MTANKLRFSRRALEALPIPAKQSYWYDSLQPGLAFCIAPGGGRAYYYCYRHGGQGKRYRLGDFSALSVDEARAKAKGLAFDVSNDVDPMATRDIARGGWTLAEAFDSYLARPAKELRPRTQEEYERAINNHCRHLLKRRLADISRRDILATQSDVIAGSGKYAANYLLSVLKAIFNHALATQHLTGENPVKGIQRSPEEKRISRISEKDLPAFLAALEAEQDEVFRDFITLLLFTGVRKTNGMQARWEQFDLQAGSWTIPRTKTGRALMIPLVGSVIEMLQRRERARVANCEWLFPGNAAAGCLSNPQRSWEALTARANLHGLRVHDLRHTYCSMLVDSGVSLPIVARLVGHLTQRTTERYAHVELRVVRDATERFSAAIDKAQAGPATRTPKRRPK